MIRSERHTRLLHGGSGVLSFDSGSGVLSFDRDTLYPRTLRLQSTLWRDLMCGKISITPTPFFPVCELRETPNVHDYAVTHSSVWTDVFKHAFLCTETLCWRKCFLWHSNCLKWTVTDTDKYTQKSISKAHSFVDANLKLARSCTLDCEHWNCS